MKNGIDTIRDVSTLTRIPESTLNSIFNTLEKEILHVVYAELVESGRNSVIINIGIGDLIITVNGEEGFITYDFIPYKSLESGIIKIFSTKESPLVEGVEKNLRNKVLSLYKELV